MKIICIGKNYALHAAELNSEVPPEPLIFLKPDSSILRKGFPFYIPEFSQEVHYEVEVVLRIDKVGKYIEERFAHKYYSKIGLGIDFTARDLQNDFRKRGFPWELSKGFDGSCFVSDLFDKKDYDLNNLDFRLEQNGKIVQKGNTKDMAYNQDFIISFVSKYYTLKKGDLIFTGTPEGVGPVHPGDRLQGYLENQQVFELEVK